MRSLVIADSNRQYYEEDVRTDQIETIQKVLPMAKSNQDSILYRDHEIKDEYHMTQKSGINPTTHKRYSCLIDGRPVKGTLDEVKAEVDLHLDKKHKS